ncbi:selenocysteinyl-tRNA-specific translation elongation factor SelB [Erwinia sp. OLTSP20]|uniref:selenocysteine-specific translation elongation factor n=1 Tax=unclassified Erwinia TaxID=2622719 RepID=UPI000C188B68|nr:MULTISPECIES: selenocysteine-specific translation elongation factor [unclassified Erwinia]PIJ49598.1 selenocysteinyl-tRNA-specific translation elongation factor SelB [Erwinia sp. OAMSP11]PIJ71594.1 selenocysteinyl-tRNA-specific translation elongation factor SelB [Erwinia sp. OLSSP12]PIJ82664.1 selenocysteinyl-tRNA-specific translation elongation factor SelB [Erwinia sp. OLCASP19]PIJ83131.1 selenocysteinyl-tRNA-specific translation elongation factor SelB [Erwinia sp. OLMTSP26]PIJ85297.1 sele
MIIATAGHIDHGKTALLHSLTGTNADRLPEEKARGMTIDLGYAYWPQPEGRVIGFIDVPGHEKFISNMLSGINGIDAALLVVACDDGVMPQTEEHLSLLSLLGRPTLSVALSKCDRVSSQRLAQVRQQVIGLARHYGWQNITCVATSIYQPATIATLAEHLRQLKARTPASGRPFRLAIDRVFTVKGAGLVVTGTCLAGEVALEDSVWLTGADRRLRVRGLHSQNQQTARAVAGERIALNLAGDISKQQVHRGDWLLTQPPPAAAQRFIVSLDIRAPIHHWQSVQIYHAVSHVTGRIALLGDDLAELISERPLWLAEEDRLIVRDSHTRQTLAGARVILLTPRKRGKRQPDYLAWLQQLANTQDEQRRLAIRLSEQPGSLKQIGWARQLTPPALTTLLAPLRPLIAGDHLILPQQAAQWRQHLLEALGRFHQTQADQPGLASDRLRRIALADKPAPLVQTLIMQLLDEGKIKNQRGWLHLPGFRLHFTAEEQVLWQQAETLFTADPWWVRDLARTLNCEETVLRLLLNKAARCGWLIAVIPDRFYHRDRINQFARLVRHHCAEHGGVSAADFRNDLAIGRKLAVQILEYFDHSGFTRRKGNLHLLRDESLFQ